MHIKSDAIIEKATKLAEGEVEFVVSSGALDSHGERINVDGIDVSQYKKNPVILWGHDGFNLPIGKATKIWKEDGKLMARASFYLKDDFARKVHDYIIDGYLKAVSIGGMVAEWGADGMTISKMIMKEFSVVSIGANPEAMVANKALSDDQVSELTGLANGYARKLWTSNADSSAVNKQIDVLEVLVATLKEVANGKTHDESATNQPTQRRVILRQAQAVDQQVETVIKTIKLKEIE